MICVNVGALLCAGIHAHPSVTFRAPIPSYFCAHGMNGCDRCLKNETAQAGIWSKVRVLSRPQAIVSPAVRSHPSPPRGVSSSSSSTVADHGVSRSCTVQQRPAFCYRPRTRRLGVLTYGLRKDTASLSDVGAANCWAVLGLEVRPTGMECFGGMCGWSRDEADRLQVASAASAAVSAGTKPLSTR
jgi:hypothetical protein